MLYTILCTCMIFASMVSDTTILVLWSPMALAGLCKLSKYSSSIDASEYVQAMPVTW